MSQNADYFILQFLEFVSCSQEQKAKDLIKNVRKEIKTVNKITDLREDHKTTITLLVQMIQNIESGKFKLAKKDHLKARNGFNRIVKECLQKRKTDISDVENLPGDVGKPTKRPKSGKMARKSTNAKGNKHEVGSSDQTSRSTRTERSTPESRPRSSFQNINKNGGPKRTFSSRREDKVRKESALSSTRSEPYLERAMYVHDQKSGRATDRQNQESTQELQSDKNMFALQMEANNPNVVKEMFESLHENEWTDAFIVLNNISEQADTETTKTLLDIVHMAYKFCHDESELQLNTIVENMCCIVASGEQKPCKEKFKSFGDTYLVEQYRLLQADCALSHLFSKFKKNVINTNDRRIYQKALQCDDFEKYLEKCVQVTWLMSLQDPPTTVLSTDRFEPSMYHPPPRNYPDVDYIEWPALMYDNNVLALGRAKYVRRR